MPEITLECLCGAFFEINADKDESAKIVNCPQCLEGNYLGALKVIDYSNKVDLNDIDEFDDGNMELDFND